MKNHVNVALFLLMLCTTTISLYAQQDTATKEEEIDYSQFADMDVPDGSKRYCTSKVIGLSPNKLLSIGYDFQGPYTLTNTDPYAKGDNITDGKADINSSGGLRLVANVPLLSNTKWLINLGGTYWRNEYNMGSHTGKNYLIHSLHQRGLTTIGLNATVFKPLNEKNFILAFVSADANGDFTLSDDKLTEYLTAPKITAVGFYGWKRNDRSMLAVGFSRTYRPGTNSVIPLVLFNHTFENKKWGIEAVFPARAAVRRSFNPRNLLLLGYELEGNSYSIINRTTGAKYNAAYNDLELRRSEIRPRITYEKAITDFIWVSAQVGYRINYNFNVDNGDIFRLLGSKQSYYMDNTLSNAIYFQISLSLVSP